eukprot:gb/GECG01014708.1/.p1 GENE.gb/GECG01014708.1/~~gb/GECG01014708.1/.p1  ORF type:complete len:310 (+),score=36.53 gb/GECG01014708.1/:1-930(+)
MEQREKMFQPSVKSNRPYIDPSNLPRVRLSRLRTFPKMDNKKTGRHHKEKHKQKFRTLDASRVRGEVNMGSSSKALNSISASLQETGIENSEHDSACATAPPVSDRGGSFEMRLSHGTTHGFTPARQPHRSTQDHLEELTEDSSSESESWISGMSEMAAEASPLHSCETAAMLNSFPSHLFGGSVDSDLQETSFRRKGTRVETLSRASVKEQTRRRVNQQFENPRAHGLAVPYRDSSSSPELAEASTSSTFQLGLKGRSVQSSTEVSNSTSSNPVCQNRKRQGPPRLQTVGAGFKIRNPGNSAESHGGA